jgi:hypothetical protein
LYCRKYDEAKEQVAVKRADFKRQFFAASHSNRRRQVPYPADCSELAKFIDWFPVAIREHTFNDPKEKLLMDLYSTPPTPYAISYKACRAYGNHWRVMPDIARLIECDGGAFKTFECGMAGTWTEQVVNTRGVTQTKEVVYVGVLTEILKLDYGPLPSPIVLFKGRWLDSKTQPAARASIRYDESGLLQADFSQELPASKDMNYVLAAQVQQVFFYPNKRGTRWRTILHKEPRSLRVFADVETAEYTVSIDNQWKHHIDLCRALSRSASDVTVNPVEAGTSRKRKR